MHLLITTDTIGGVWTYTRELVTGLCGRGARVTLVSFGEIPTQEQTAWMDGLPRLDYRPTAFCLEWMQDSSADLEASSEYLRAIIAEVRPDVLHLNQFCYGALPVSVPKVVVGHSDVLSWWNAVHGELPRESSWIRSYRHAVSSGLAAASFVVAPSAWMLNQLVEHYPLPPKRCVIHNGMNPGNLNPHSSKEDLVVSVGRLWDAGKHVALLLEHDHSIPVCIVGPDNPPGRGAPAGIPVRHVREGVVFSGPQSCPRLAQLLSRASIYVATSRYEPFGLAPLEAALSRCALIVNDIQPFREIWADAALYFEANNAHSLAGVISQLGSSRELCLDYANRAYNRARTRFTAERMVDAYWNLYASLIARVPEFEQASPAGVASL